MLPGASSAEGIAAGAGSTFYAGDLLGGDIFRGDLQRGTAALFIDAPDGRWAAGMAADVADKLLFVAGGATGQGYVYDTRTGTSLASYQFAAAGSSFINDVALTKDGAWFTDSAQAKLYFVQVNPTGILGSFDTLLLIGPAADLSADFNLNGIQATANGKTLIVAHSGTGQLYTVNPATGESATIAGLSVPSVDGIVLRGTHIWAVQNVNQVTKIRLRADLTSGTTEESSPAAHSRYRPRRSFSAADWRQSTQSSIPVSAHRQSVRSGDSRRITRAKPLSRGRPLK